VQEFTSMGEDRYWIWRAALLLHPDGRAVGGEHCIQCGYPVPPNAHWVHRDRHVCSDRCNHNLARRFKRSLDRNDIPAIPQPEPRPNPRSRSQPASFRMISVDPSDPEAFPYDFDGYCPLNGDMVERDGVVTTYQWIRAGDCQRAPEYAPHGLHAAVHASGHQVVSVANQYGEATRTWYGIFLPDGNRRIYDANSRAFAFANCEFRWVHELIRHTDEAGEYSWEAWVAVPTSSAHPGTIWSRAYLVASQRRHRASSSSARHARRLRVHIAAVERFDPFEVYDRDSWVCGICLGPVDQEIRWPDLMSASLDHVMPLVAGGQHTPENTQIAHWICNVRKGATTP
jgi:predicted nucleic acid-binding Zn ribbon protein